MESSWYGALWLAGNAVFLGKYEGGTLFLFGRGEGWLVYYAIKLGAHTTKSS